MGDRWLSDPAQPHEKSISNKVAQLDTDGQGSPLFASLGGMGYGLCLLLRLRFSNFGAHTERNCPKV